MTYPDTKTKKIEVDGAKPDFLALMMGVCTGCNSSEHLYADKHGTFCRECGPGARVK